jgi:integrase
VARVGKEPVLTDDVKAMVACAGPGLRGARDRALVLLGYAGAMRRSEICAVMVEHLSFRRDNLELWVPRSKGDQEGRGRRVGVVASGTGTCPVAALRLWLAEAGISKGPAFRAVDRWGNLSAEPLCDRTVALVVKRLARASAVADPAVLAGHSLRAGHVTQSLMNGAEEWSAQAQVGHARRETLQTYIRRANLFVRNSSASLGL